MTEDQPRENIQQQQELFSEIAPHYDLMNHLMTWWQDERWRRFVIARARLPSTGHLLDLGTGTGKLALEARRQHPGSRITAADITLPMMLQGQKKRPSSSWYWICAAAGSLPFEDDSFEAVVSSFLVRNLSNLPRGLTEQYRVLKPGGRAVILDTTRPPQNSLTPLIRVYLHRVIPFLGQILTGNRSAYTYLPESTEAFLESQELAEILVSAGFKAVGFRKFMLGMIAVHWGEK